MNLRNSVATALEERGLALGTWVQSMNPDACEIAGSSGFDFVIIDMEHGTFGWDGLAQMMRAVDSTPASAIVRLPDQSPAGIKKALDSGALGVLIPNIKTAEDVKAVVRASRFHPKGDRGGCPMVRATAHGVIPWSTYSQWCNANTQVWINIETLEAVENIDSILDCRPDAIVLGIFDLSLAMGLDGQHDHPRVRSALEGVLAAAKAKKIDAITVCFETDEAAIETFCQPWMESGCRIFVGLMDRTYLRLAYQRKIAGFRRLVPRREATAP